EHALVGFGCMMAGIPYAPISPAYSLLSTDHAKLKHIFSLLTPGLMFLAEGAPFEAALKSVMSDDIVCVVARDPAEGVPALSFEAVLDTKPTDAVDQANARIDGDTIAK